MTISTNIATAIAMVALLGVVSDSRCVHTRNIIIHRIWNNKIEAISVSYIDTLPLVVNIHKDRKHRRIVQSDAIEFDQNQEDFEWPWNAIVERMHFRMKSILAWYYDFAPHESIKVWVNSVCIMLYHQLNSTY